MDPHGIYMGQHGASMGRGVYSTMSFRMAARYTTATLLPGRDLLTEVVLLVAAPSELTPIQGDGGRALLEILGDARMGRLTRDINRPHVG